MSLTITTVLAISFSIVFLHGRGVNSFTIGDTKCYKGLGCFFPGGPFVSSARPVSLTPNSPDKIQTMFHLHTRDNKKDEQKLDARNYKDVKTTWTYFKNRPTKFIVHGYLDNTHIFSWLRDMKTELLKQGDYNVIIVDWHKGNLFLYSRATANTRVIGAQIAVLIEQLETDFQLSPGDVHVIGHSLGSHIAGYAGERIPGMGRITGLDPAGPYFSGTDKVVRLDPTDALLVDVIHSDGENILKLGLGMREPVGHMDFYPNLGHDQPGCEKTIVNFFTILLNDGVAESVACNHLRAIKFFEESINSKCAFMAFPCSGEDAFKSKKCRTCGDKGCASMGLKAEKYKPPKDTYVKYYIDTSDDAPFCLYQLNILIHFARTSKATDERGTTLIRLHGDNGPSDWIELDSKPVDYYPGSTYEREVERSSDIGKLKYIEFQWHHSSSIFSGPFKWNIFNIRKPKLYLRAVDIEILGSGEKYSFCAGDAAVENKEPLIIFKHCK